MNTKIPITAAGTQDTFYPGATTIGDILAKEGYNQELLVGSDAVFGGRAQYFSGHGNYKIFDYVYAMENGYIPQGYKVWWGYEDEKLFDFRFHVNRVRDRVYGADASDACHRGG